MLREALPYEGHVPPHVGPVDDCIYLEYLRLLTSAHRHSSFLAADVEVRYCAHNLSLPVHEQKGLVRKASFG